MNTYAMFIGGLIAFVIMTLLIMVGAASYQIGKDKIYEEVVEHNCGYYAFVESTNRREFIWGKQ